ncbi:class I SAM-dependent methyltransferase [Flammeovirga kamogawensis]|uniref:Class I SAM-dependent methyltransferase n=1 Tax=Flammeovirga kamogawensis TaxID=373891 RepID=A0ABX8GYR9_9BACT|nr:class I SAM-dependent methyltransferase [Flammeovirga kamogawensis]MBB6459190.1 trans-aconitate methyltransferase [Flammeovirga kamogawensis]QWG08755.1 class I SAM-dependent methyltransferase [Flammeovirga kamogawensis]TRX67048.1 class I SAM-dependent methyltransferase [Flammeovirga kamogawensis]
MTNIDNWDTSLFESKHAFVFDYGEDVVRLLQPKQEERILDLGCGSGQLTNLISKSVKEVIGIDSSIEMIEQAKQNYPSINFYQKDATAFKFYQKFDAIFSNATLHWIKDYHFCIQSMYSNLKEGGRIVVEFGGKGNIEKIEKALKKILLKYGYIDQSEFEQWFFPSIGEYSLALEKVGFKVTFAEHFDRPTKLEDTESGIKDLLKMFGKNFLIGVLETDVDLILEEVQESLREDLFIDNEWFADYKRIRIVATKEVV